MIFRPDIKLDRITEITVELLNKHRIEALILDVDNTLSTHHGQVLTDGLTKWLEYMKANNIKLTVLSNSKEKRVKPFAQKIGLDFISLGLKPLPFGYMRAVKFLKTKYKHTAIVGDQIFTDIIGGNFLNLKTIWLTPIQPEPMLSFRIRRNLEKKIVKLFKITKTEV